MRGIRRVDQPSNYELVSAPERRSSVVHATSELRRAILAGRMAPGSEVSITALSQQLGMSAIPVREALRALEAEGLILMPRNRKVVVAPISLADLEQIFRARRIYEVHLCVRAATEYTPAALDRLTELTEALAAEGSLDLRRELHNEFHRLLVLPAASAFDLRLMQLMWNGSDRYVRFTSSVFGGPALADFHRGLLTAAREQDPALMLAEMSTHIDEGGQRVAAALGTAIEEASEWGQSPAAR